MAGIEEGCGKALHRIWLARWVPKYVVRQGAKTRESVVLPCCCAVVLQDCVLFQ